MKKILTHWIKASALFALLLSFNITSAQNFEISVRNLAQTAPNVIEFDAYLLDTDAGTPFQLATCQLGFLFNSLIYTGGTISVTIDNTGSGLNIYQQFTAAPSVATILTGYPDQTLIRLAGRIPPGAGNGTIISTSGYGTLLTHFVVSSTVNFTANSTPDFTFNSSSVNNPLYPTRVFEYVGTTNTELTVTSGVNAIVYDNPELNPPPAAFAVTGTGSYCEGSAGLPVGLSGSETGVTYTLYKDAAAQVPTVAGTGSPISFGAQTAGTYTVSGTNSTGTTAMTGSVLITEIPSPAAPTVTLTQPTCSVATGTITVTDPTGAGFTYSIDGSDYTNSTGLFTLVNPGSYNVTARNAAGCTSSITGVTIDTQPPTPTAPVIGTITPPTCSLATGSVVLGGLPSTGTWTLTRNPGGVTSTGTGNSTTVSGLAAGTYTFTVTNSFGCISLSSAGVTIDPQPPTPTAPVVGTITAPTCTLTTGSVVLSGLPSTGTWTLTRSPGGATSTGTGTSTTVSGLSTGVYTYTVTTSDGCISPSSANIVIPAIPASPAAPAVGTITPPTCTVSTGSVVLSGLPSTGTWTLTRYPGTVTTTGSGSSTTIAGLATGTYNYTVTNDGGCVSALSANVVIPLQPPTPSAPVPGTLTQPTCALSTGSVILNGLPSAGTWTINPGSVTGTGTSTTVSGLAAGTYNFTVTNSDGCTSAASGNVVINAQPPTPSAPVPGALTQPTCSVATGSVVLSGLPSTGTWTINPGSVSGSGTTTTISGLAAGTYNFTVTSSLGCTSLPSTNVVINVQPPSPSSPTQTIDCSLGSGNAAIQVISPTGAGYEYRIDGGTYQSGTDFTGVINGTHTITVRNSSGCTTTGASFDVSCGCVNPPTVVLSSNSGSTCGTSPVTVTGNIFGGSATAVTLTENGAGTVSPVSTGSSPFSFTYTPAPGDAGNVITITVTTNNPLLAPCAAAIATYALTVNAIPSAPSIGSIAQPTCSVATGSVVLNGLPSTGTWTLTRSPGAISTTGSGTSTTISGLAPGTYSYTVSSAAGCISASSANIVINAQPETPAAPVVGTITPPSCTTSTGSVALSGLPLSGTWTITRTPGGITTTGTGVSITISSIPSGTYTFTVTSSAGCISPASSNAIIPVQPPTPTAPSVGTIVPPTCSVPTGSVTLDGLPVSGSWTLTRYPGTVTTTGSGTSITISGLATGTYNYTVTNSLGCTSLTSSNVVIPVQPSTPTAPIVGTITQPTCGVATGSVVLSGLPSTGTWTLTRSPGGTTTPGSGTGTTISGLAPGTYTYTVANADGCISVSSANIVINTQPPTPSSPVVGTITQPTCAVSTGSVALSGLPAGTWTLTRLPGGATTTGTGSGITITGLAPGTYSYTVTSDAGCVSLPSAEILINAQPLTPSAPVVGTITQPTCAVSTGSIVLSGLPSTGSWTLTRNPGGVTTAGSGTGTTVSGLTAATYSFTVTNSVGCTSVASASVVINVQPLTPTAPVAGSITSPTCTISTGSVVLNGLPATGTWTLTRSPGGITINGTGSSTTISGLNTGTYTFTVTTSAGCVSPSSNNVVIPVQPPTPLEPTVGTITPPTCTVSTGSVELSGLPSTGTWILTRLPGTVTTTGTGTSRTISGLATGIYNYTVTNSSGCVSSFSENVVIPSQPPSPSAPTVGAITQPTCAVATGSVVLSGLPSTGTWTITRSPGGITTTGSGTAITVSGLPAGSYTFTVTNSFGCISLASSAVVINTQPVTPSAPVPGTIVHPTCTVSTGSVVLSGLPSTGTWTLNRSPGNVTTSGTGTSTTVTGLPSGAYTFTVTSSAGCISVPSSGIVINAQPILPESPVQSIDCSLGFGNATVTVTSPTGTGYQYRIDGGSFQNSTTFTGVSNGTHTITVMNSAGCTTTGSSFDVSCGCVNPPTVTLGATSGSTCGISAVTVTGNIFGGSATAVTLTENGAGTLIPSSSNSSPFSFTYTPAPSDAGKLITITVTTNNPLGTPCAAATATYALTVNPLPSAPVVGARIQPTCSTGTGSVVLSGLPSTGTWTLIRSPGGTTTNGTGTSTTIAGLIPGTYTFTVTGATGCTSVSSSSVVIDAQPVTPSAPLAGTITQPTCALSTGSVVLSGLPSTGTWTVIRSPGSVIRTGSGTSVTISAIPSGTYTFTVTNSSGCISLPSAEVVIEAQPGTPAAPAVSTITPPTCSESTGSVMLLGLPSSGTWTITRYPGTVTTTGSGPITIITGLATGTYNFTVTSEAGCISVASSNVVILVQPPTPSAPVVGTVTQPSFTIPTGSVVLSGLPSSGTWTITRSPGDVGTTGTGTSRTITGLEPGVFTFTVTNSSGCTSLPSAEVIISTPGIPDLVITNPDSVCTPETVDLTASSVTEGSTPGLTYTYWTDSDATIEYLSPTNAADGTYYIKGITISGYFDIKPVVVTVFQMPVANAGPDQELDNVFETTLQAVLQENETGTWLLNSGSANIYNISDPETEVRNLAVGVNILQWTVINGVCPESIDYLEITVNELVIPTLITPNGDPYNEYFVLQGISNLGRTELIIFDRRGAQVYKNMDYDNSWNGLDYNENPLPDDTYFFAIKTENGRSISGYIVIRR